MKKLYLVDVSAMYFRAFYAIRPLTNKKGLPTNALYGFLSMTSKLLKQAKSDYMAFCFDHKKATFRKEIYDGYKANRGEMPEELVPQVPYVRKITDALGIPAFVEPGFEADDIIGSLTKYGRENDLEVVIVSGDKDFAQLIAPFVSMYDSMKEVRYDVDGAIEKWGVRPDQMIDYLSIVGDSSDNIPGVKGIGPKGAQKLLAEFNNLETIYESLDQITAKGTLKKLQESKEEAFLSQKLVTIVQDMNVVESLDELRLRPIVREELTDLLDELEFKSFAKNLLGAESAGTTVKGSAPKTKTKTKKDESAQHEEPAQVEVKAVEVENNWKDLEVSELSELEKLIPAGEKVWGLWNERGLFLGADGHAIHYQGGLEGVGAMLSEKKVKWCGHDLKELWKSLNVVAPEIDWDQMLAAYVVRAGSIGEFNEIYQLYAGGHVPELASAGQLMACHEALRKVLEERVDERSARDVLQNLELPLVRVLFEMEQKGILMDTDELTEQSASLAADIQRLEKSIHKEAGEAFNVASTKQLAQILFEKMKIPPVKKTKTGYSTDNDVLEKLAVEHQIARDMIEYRELTKLKSTYVDALPLLLNKETGRIHTHLKQAHTATGRLSSQNPNLQNIPIRTERGNMVRKAFIAPPEKKLLSIDYSQIELRILAHITEDPGLCEAFDKDQDIHAATASHIYEVDIEEVTADQRRNAKAVNFGIAYGQGPFGLAENLGISRKEASEIIAQYFGRFSKVRDYMHDVVEEGKKKGYVETTFGRRRYLEELASKNGRIRKFGERAAINAPIQGTASDLVKKAMIDVHQKGVSGLLLQVHDELLLEVPDQEVDATSQLVSETMSEVAALKVPLKVNVASGQNWEEAHA